MEFKCKIVEYFHVFVNDELKFVSLSLGATSEYSSLARENSENEVKVYSYLADPKVLEAISDSYDLSLKEEIEGKHRSNLHVL